MATITPRIREAALAAVADIAKRYDGYDTDLVNALVNIARQQDASTTPAQRQTVASKLIERIGTQAITLGGGQSA